MGRKLYHRKYRKVAFPKNQMFILDIFEKLIKKEPKVRLILIGDGEDRTKLDRFLNRMQMQTVFYASPSILGW